MPHSDDRAITVGHEAEFDGARARWNALKGVREVQIALPSPRQQEPMRGLDSEILAAGPDLWSDHDSVRATGARIQFHVDSVPAAMLLRIGEIREDRVRGAADPVLDLDRPALIWRHPGSPFIPRSLPPDRARSPAPGA